MGRGAAAGPGSRRSGWNPPARLDGVVVTGMPVPAPEDRIAVLLADPYSFPADAFVAESAEQLGGLPLTGGLAGAMARWRCPALP